MTWSTPTTAAGGVLTSAFWNAQVRDNLKTVGDAWGSWTPAWTGASSDPAIGNGTKVGGYMASGKFVRFWISVTMGSSTTYGSGAWQFDVPVTEAAHRWLFDGVTRDVSASKSYPVSIERTASGVFTVRADALTAGGEFRSLSSTVPFAWATGDEIFLSGVYEAA